MPFASRLIHSLAIVTPGYEDELDDYGHPIPAEPTTVLTQGLIQPKKATEVALISQAGPMVSDHTIYLEPRDVANGAYLRREPDDGERFEVVGVRSFAYGRSPHLAIDAKRITAGGEVPAPVAS
jgi:hypothetical protein